MNFRTRLEGSSHLTVTAQPVPPVPPELASWTQSDEVLDVAGRLLE